MTCARAFEADAARVVGIDGWTRAVIMPPLIRALRLEDVVLLLDWSTVLVSPVGNPNVLVFIQQAERQTERHYSEK